MKRYTVPLLVYFATIALGTTLRPADAKVIQDDPGSSVGMSASATGCYLASGPVASEPAQSLNDIPVYTGDMPAGSYGQQLDPAGEGPGHAGSAHLPCNDSRDTSQRLSVWFGNRTRSADEILDQVDGIHMNYHLNKELILSGIAGYPALSDEDRLNPTRGLLGISASTQRFSAAWDLKGFLFEQRTSGADIRDSLGGVIRYRQPAHSMLVYLDFDLAEKTFGTSTVSGAWRLPSKTTISSTLDRRNRSLPSLQEGYLKQAMTAVEGWHLALPADRLALYTREPGGQVSTVAMSLSHTLSRRLQLRGDVAMLTSGADANTDTALMRPSKEYIYHSRFTGRGLIQPGDRYNLDLRYNVTQSGRISTAVLDTKYAINRYWNIVPALRSDYYSAAPENTPRRVTSPTVKMEYRRNKLTRFQIEAGSKGTAGTQPVADVSRPSYFVALGYQAKF